MRVSVRPCGTFARPEAHDVRQYEAFIRGADPDTVGNLGRLFTDVLEEIEDGPIEATETTGADEPQTVTFGMLSQVFTPFIAWTLTVFEIDVRIAVGLGIIGAGGSAGCSTTSAGCSTTPR